jgi:hypothetical protein
MMSKAKTNALDALRALIAERQQYEQWITALESKREGTPEHVFERVQGDYRARLGKVVDEIKSHSEELQLSISTLSARLVEVARDEDTRREGLQEAELRAAVGEYEPGQWEQIRTEAEASLEKIAADRVSLDGQLAELRAIQKLSEMSPDIPSSSSAPIASAPQAVETISSPAPDIEIEPIPPAIELDVPAAIAASPEIAPTPTIDSPSQMTGGHRAGTAAEGRNAAPASPREEPEAMSAAPPQVAAPSSEPGLDQVAAAASAAAGSAGKPRSMKSPTGGVQAVRSRTEAARPDSQKTLRCPECGTANHPTEWYCERCGGELATM